LNGGSDNIGNCTISKCHDISFIKLS